MTVSNNITNSQKYFQPLVGVIDTGFSANAPDVDYSQIYLGSDFIDGDDNPLLAEGVGNKHGSHVLQIIKAANTKSLWLGRAVGSGKWAESLIEFVEAAKAAGYQNAVVNLSFDLVQVNSDGSVTTRYELTSYERAAIEYARQNCVLIVAAAGNEGGAISALGQASQEFDNIITVGAAEGLSRAHYSSYGNGLTLLADGSGFGNTAGTSAAAARVTRSISQLWAVNPQLSYYQLIDIIKTTATDLNTPGWDVETGFGLLNLSDAINLATFTTPIPNYILTWVTSPTWEDLIVENAIAILERPASLLGDFVDAVGDVIKGGAKGLVKIGEVFVDAATFPFKAAGEAVKFITDKLGDGLESVFDAVGLGFAGDVVNFLSDRAGEKIQGIIERGIQYIEKLPSRLERTANDLFSDNLWNNFGRWLSQNLINTAELLGIPETAETLADLLKFNTRALTDEEKKVARSVFGDSIDLNLVRIDEWSVSNLVNGRRPFTTFNTINTWGSLTDDVLIHELTHVWQYGQVGAIYIPDAVDAQNSSEGYNYGGSTELEKRIAAGQKLSSFNYEQQAQIVQDYYKIREDKDSSNDKLLPVYVYFVQEVSTLPLTTLTTSAFGLLLGSDNSDQLNGGSRDETLFGLAGDDFIDGGLGNDRMYGGLGNDTFVVNSPDDLVIEFPDQGIDTVNSFISYTLGDNLENLTLIGNAPLDGTGNSLDNIITGNGANNILNGLAGNDALIGGGGNDTLIGGSGSDSMLGGAGDDTYEVDNSADTVTELANEGIDTVNSSISYTLGDNLENLTVIGNNAINGTGNSLDNIITGNGANNILNGLAGNDTLIGGGGNDTLIGGSGSDSMLGGAGDDTYEVDNSADTVTELANEGIDTVNSSISYTLGDNLENLTLIGNNAINGTGNSLDNIITGNGANNTLNGLAGNDALIGGGGNDTLIGGEGSDSMQGGIGDDTYEVDNSADTVTEFANQGIDTVNSSISYTLGDNLENLTLIGNTAINGTGNSLDNIITGNDANNTLNGLAGNDTLIGGGGDDTLYGGTGDDQINGGDGNDQLFGDEGNDTLRGAAGDDFIDGGNNIDTVSYDNSPNGVVVNIDETNNYQNSGSGFHKTIVSNVLIPTSPEPNFDIAPGTAFDGFGNTDTLRNLENIIGSQQNDVLIGNGLNNRIEALGGNDLLIGNAGADTLDGGNGSDSVSYRYDSGVVTIDLSAGTAIDSSGSTDTLISIENVTGSAGDDTIIGTDDANVIFAGAGNDKVSGRGGNDILFGEAGKDTLEGEAGDDFLVGGLDADVLNGGDGNDTASYFTSATPVSVSLTTGTGWAGDAKGDQLIGIENLEGSEFEDLLIGDSGNNILSGLGGNDLLYGEAGDDWLDGGTESDRLYGGDGNDKLYGQAGEDLLKGEAGNDQLFGGDGNDQLYGQLGNDTLNGEAGNDYLEGGEGDDQLLGADGNDQLYGQSGNDILNGGTGDDLLDGGIGDDQLSGGDGDDQLYGQVGKDILDGGAGNDLLDGGEGNDQLNGSDGNDRLYGQVGEDTLNGGAGNDLLDGGTGNDLLSGGDGNDQLYGQAGEDTLEGGAGNDAVYGGTGADTLLGQAGDDYLDGGLGNDTLDGGEGNDRLYGQQGDDLLTGGTGDDYLDGGVGNDQLFGNDGNDRLYGQQGYDTLDGGAGADFLDGGIGDDWLYGRDGSDRLYGQAGNDYLDGGAGDDRLEGGTGDDQLLGQQGRDYLDGGTGDDFLWGGDDADRLLGQAGNDYLDGGSGDDQLLGGLGNDQLYGQNGNDTLDGSIGNDYLEGGDGNDQLTGGNGNDYLYGQDGSDTLNGGTGNDNLYGGSGDDQLLGGDGNDLLSGQDGNDLLDAGAGDDYLEGGSGMDQLTAGLGNDQLYGGDGNDRLDSGAGNDYLEGGLGDDQLTGGDGDDQLDGQEGSDILDGGNGNDNLRGGDGADVLRGQAGDDYLEGDNGDDLLYGGAGNNSLFGGAGNDQLYGGEGDNILNGGTGQDTLYGGSGRDMFVLETGAGSDTIFNFVAGTDYLGLNGLTFEQLTIDQGTGTNASDTLISNQTSGELLATLVGVEANTLNLWDFAVL